MTIAVDWDVKPQTKQNQDKAHLVKNFNTACITYIYIAFDKCLIISYDYFLNELKIFFLYSIY